MKCSIDRAVSITSTIMDKWFLDYSFLDSLEMNPQEAVQMLEAEVEKEFNEPDFKLESFISALQENNQTDELEYILGAFQDFGVDLTKDTSIRIRSNRSTISPQFSSSEVLNIFHNQSDLKQKYINYVTPLVAKAVYIGPAESNVYVTTDDEVNTNFNRIRSDVFSDLQKFLIDKGYQLDQRNLWAGPNEVDFDNYKATMIAAVDYFTSTDNFSRRVSSLILGKDMPLIPTNNHIITKAFLDFVFLNNFDNTISQITPGVGIATKHFNTFNSDLNTPKYTRNSKGLVTEYWSRGDHESTSSEQFEDDLTKLIVSSIPMYQKDGKTVQGLMQMKQLYLLGARIAKFELQNNKFLRENFKDTFVSINESPEKALDFYINLVTDPNVKLTKQDRFTKLLEIKEVLYSLKHFIDNNNIDKKSENSGFSIKHIISQVLNNNRGGMYSVYNANGYLEVKEMSNFDFQVSSFNSWTYNKIFNNPKEDYEDLSEVDKLFTENDSDSLFRVVNGVKQSAVSSRTISSISKFLLDRFASGLNESAFNLMILDMNAQREGTQTAFETIGDLKAALKNMLTVTAKIHDDVKDSKETDSRVFGDASAIQTIGDLTSNPLFIAYRNGWLENYVVSPQMNIELLTGEKIPTFKITTLVYKDLELFEVHNLNKKASHLYENIFINPYGDQESPLLGTQVKLEATSPNKTRNKQADKFNVAENFNSNFLFDFLKQLAFNDANMKSSFGVMLGNYSDKGTILLKMIDGNYMHQGQKVISMSTSDLSSLIRRQGFDFYKDAAVDVINDYVRVFKNLDIKNALNGVDENATAQEITEAFNKIDKTLKSLKGRFNSIYDINSFLASKGVNSGLMEELHYTKYNGEVTTNRALLSNIHIFGSDKNFDVFIDRIFKSFESDYKKYVSEDKFLNIPGEVLRDLDNLISRDMLNISLTGFKSDKGIKVSNKGQLNPLIQKWILLNMLYRNEYLFISAKGEYMHPHKAGDKVKYTSDFDLSPNSEFWNNYDTEASWRLTSMAKRNVLYTAPIEAPVRKSRFGVPEKINHAVIQDTTAKLPTISGGYSNVDIHDGSSFTDYTYNKMLEASYPGKGYEGTKKPFGTFITPNGVVIKKDAESIITNETINLSKKSNIRLKDKKKQMLSIPIGQNSMQKLVMDLSSNQYYYNEKGKLIQIRSIISEKADNGLNIKLGLLDTSTNTLSERNENIENLYQLWELLGAEYSTDSKGNLNENSNDLLTRFVTSAVNKDGEYFLKDKIIHIISNASAVKAGGMSVNNSDAWTNSNRLAFSTHHSRFLGIQLDANSEADQSKIKEVTQVISALSQNRRTAHIADEAYANIEKVIAKSAEKYNEYITNWMANGNSTKEDLYKFIARKFVDDVQHMKGDNIAKEITRALQNFDEIPLSNQNFFPGFVRSVITDLNNHFISRYYSGMGAVLLPSHNIIQIYDVPIIKADGTTEFMQMTYTDLINRALASNIGGNTNDEVVDNYIKEKLQPIEIELGDIELGDVITYQSIEDGTTITKNLNSPEEYYKFKQIADASNVVFYKVLDTPRDLKPQIYKWVVNGRKYNAFDMDFVRIRLLNKINPNALSDLDRVFLDQLQARFPDKKIDELLLKMQQRNLDLLSQGKVMKTLSELNEVQGINFVDALIGEDLLYNTISNYTDHYNNTTYNISNYEFSEAEVIMGDIYANIFGLENETLADVKEQGAEYFRSKLQKRYDANTWTKDIPKFKLVYNNGTNIFVNLVESEIRDDDLTSIEISKKTNPLDPKEVEYFIKGYDGKELIKIPSNLVTGNIIKAKLVDGDINLYLKTYEKDGKLRSDLRTNAYNLINLNKRNILTLVPPIDSDINNLGIIESTVDKNTKNVINRPFDFNIFIKSLENLVLDIEYKNIDDLITLLANQMYASWEKSHEFIASRIPSQSMQSFMPMKLKAYLKTKSNDAYVSVWQILFQGSDFDVDKAYMLGYGFRGNSTLDINNLFDYNTKEELDIIEKMPLPSGNTIILSKSAENSLDLTEDFNALWNIVGNDYNFIFNDKKYVGLNAAAFSIIKDVLNKIPGNTSVFVNNSNRVDVETFVNIFNRYNADKSYLNSPKLVSNSVVTKINEVIKDPANQINATSPVDNSLKMWKDVGNKKGENPILSPHNMLGMFKQQYDAQVGKEDVGISANGLKVFFALSSYYNNYYRNNFESNEDAVRRSMKTFRKEFTVEGKRYVANSMADIDITEEQKAVLLRALVSSDDNSFRNSGAAELLSGFTSAATDNAKELVMAKINANTQLASMHIYLVLLGLSAEETVDIMTSGIAKQVLEGLTDNIFLEDKSKSVETVLEKIIKNSEDPTEAKNFLKIYQGAREITTMARLLGVNQKIKANIKEMHKFLTTYETLMFSREDILFGDRIMKFKQDLATIDGVVKSELNPVQFNSTLETMANIIIDNSSGRFLKSDLEYIKGVLKEASNVEVSYLDHAGNVRTKNVSILGGEFEYRYFINSNNEKYQKIVRKYYDLIKDTFNVFDVVNSVPHFRKMLESLHISHNLLMMSSVKYNTAFNLLKDLVKRYGHKMISDHNTNVKNVLNNPGFGVKVTDEAIDGVMLYVDNLVKSKWLQESSNVNIVLNVATIQDLLRRADLNSFKVYTTDNAMTEKKGKQSVVSKSEAVIYTNKNSTVPEEFTIDLKTSYGIANFKNLVERVLLPILIKYGDGDLKNLLKIRDTFNLFGLQGSLLAPAFSITDKNIPATAEKIEVLSRAFNSLDMNTSSDLQLPNNMKWRQVLFLYNTIVNNEKYGDKRLTPLMEEYIKESDSAGMDLIKYFYKLDSGQLSVFDINTFDLQSTEDKTTEDIIKESNETLAKTILWYAYKSKDGVLTWSRSTAIQNLNSDFSMPLDMAESEFSKKTRRNMQVLFNLLSENNFLIEVKC